MRFSTNQNIENFDIKWNIYKWWKLIFYHIIGIVINNSFIIYNKYDFEKGRLKFKRNLIDKSCLKKKNIEEKETKSF